MSALELLQSNNSYPWVIVHKVAGAEHIAWFQRALLPGDFAPRGKARGGTGTGYPLPNYVMYGDGRSPDPDEQTPRCQGCGVHPKNDDLTPVERATGTRNFLVPFRTGRVSWTKAAVTDPHTCYVCNHPLPLAYDGVIKLCEQCEENLAKGGQ